MLLPTLATLLSLASASAAAVKRGFDAPHYSVYLNDEFSYDAWPGPDKIKPYNRALMAFWQTDGAQATPASWESFTDEQRQSILSAYHDAGIALMVSAFGDADKVISTKTDPVGTAQAIAAWVKKYAVDGVDIDLEDFTPLQNDRDYSLDWLTKFHNELATQLPGAPISSTPTAWMYGAAFGSQDSVYCKLHAAVGEKISWYQLQLYNGQKGAWNTCENTLWNSADPTFLSLGQVASMCGIPQSSITVGRLWDTSDLATADSHDQIPAAADNGACIAQAKEHGYPGTGMMVWSAHKDNWAGANDYLSGTLAGIESYVASAPAANSSAAASTPASNSSPAASPSSAANAASVVSASSSSSSGTTTNPQSSTSGSSNAAAHSAGAAAAAAANSGATKAAASLTVLAAAALAFLV
jgi:chitinase